METQENALQQPVENAKESSAEKNAETGSHFEQVKESMELLYKAFPKAFVKEGDCKPLKIGIFGTVGNVLGSMFNYWVGTFGRVEWIEKYLHVKRKSLEKAQRFVGGHGAWIGFFCFLPILGSGIAIALGMLRSNVVLTTTSVFLGKAIRYAIVIGVYVMFKVVL